MKLTTFFLLVSLFQMYANDGYAQKTKISLDLEDVTVEEVFDKIELLTDFKFFINVNQVDLTKIVDAKFKRASIKTILDNLLKGSGIKYKIRNKQIILPKKITTFKDVQGIEVQGIVTDEEGLPLAGVTIIQKGTSRGTSSDFDGKYKILVPENAVLVFSYIGFETQEITVNNQKEINVQLKESVSKLDEITIVATGYQTLSKERSAGSYSKAAIDVVQNRSTSTNVLDRLDGLVPGLVINNAPNTGDVDNSILIRGLNSIRANTQPLFVVDGVPITDVSRINPQDVADVYVLKDATATSIYGARATNGIIVITTKKGTKNKKTQIDYDSYISFQGKPDLNYTPRLNSEQFIQTAREIFDPTYNLFSQVSNLINTRASVATPLHEEILYDLDNGIIDAATADARLNELAGFDNLNQIEDLFYRNATLVNHTLSVRGGGEKYSFYGSVAYTNAQNSVPGDTDEAYKLNINQDFKFNDHIAISLTTDLTNRRVSGNKPLNVSGSTLPYTRFRDAAGNNLNTNFMQPFSRDELPGFETATGINLQYVPLDEVNAGYTNGDDLNARINLGLDINVLKGLKLEGRYGYVYGDNNTTSFDKEDSYVVRKERAEFVQAGPNGPIYFLPETGGHYVVSNTKQRDWLFRNQLSYSIAWNDNIHQLTLLLGQEAQETFLSSSQSYTRGFNNRLLTSIPVDYAALTAPGLANPIISNAGAASSQFDVFDQSTIPFSTTEITNRISSYYGNAGYTYNNKYVLNGSWRIDESNLFGLDKSAQNRPVWSVGAKWIMGKEDFFKNVKGIDELALRLTYGITGNAPIPGEASSFDILSPGQNFANRDPALQISNPANDKLTWESTENINIGLDYKLFNSRINGSIDYYHKKTTDLIGFLETNILTGFPSVIGNLGDMENKGLEITLNSLNISNENFSWYTGLNLAHNKNKVTKLNTRVPIATAADIVEQRFVEGQSAFTIYAYDFVGLDDLGDPLIRLADGTVTKTPDVAQAEDAVFMGSYLPKVTGGLSNTFTYKGFSLNTNMVFSFGAVLRVDGPNGNALRSDYSGGRLFPGVGRSGNFTVGNVHSDIFNRWKQPGDENITNIPSYVVDEALNLSRRDTRYYSQGNINVVSADYLKLRDITLSYALPESIISKINLEGLSLRLQLSNVLLWRANDKNIDPEFHDPFLGRRDNVFNQETITVGIHISL